MNPSKRPKQRAHVFVCFRVSSCEALLLSLTWALGVAADDLDLVRDHGRSAILHLERDVLDEESPHLVAEAVGIQGALKFDRKTSHVSLVLYGKACASMRQSTKSPLPCYDSSTPQCAAREEASPYLKRQPGLDLILQNIRNGSIKVGEDLHGQLRVDAVALDEVIQSVCQGSADAVHKRRAQRLLAIL